MHSHVPVSAIPINSGPDACSWLQMRRFGEHMPDNLFPYAIPDNIDDLKCRFMRSIDDAGVSRLSPAGWIEQCLIESNGIPRYAYDGCREFAFVWRLLEKRLGEGGVCITRGSQVHAFRQQGYRLPCQ